MFGEISASHKVSPSLQYGESVLSSSYAITAAVGTYVDTGLHLPLPSAGTYLVGMNVRADIRISTTTTGFITTKLYRTDTTSYVANSERLVVIDDVSNAALINQTCQNESAYTIPIAVNSACRLDLYVKRDGGATAGEFLQSAISSDENGWTSLNYIKIG